jgi:hypothetical protein
MMKVFVPFSEALVEQYGCVFGELVPYQLEYHCYPVEFDRAAERQQDQARVRQLKANAVKSRQSSGR